jgi:hypothetical protein
MLCALGKETQLKQPLQMSQDPSLGIRTGSDITFNTYRSVSIGLSPAILRGEAHNPERRR